MRRELLRVGMSQMSAGSKTDVGAYHRDDSQATEENLADLQVGGRDGFRDAGWGAWGLADG